MKKYYIGLMVIALLTIGLTVFVITQAGLDKQDGQTSKQATDIATKLNAYTDQSQTAPATLAAAGITDAPSTISYTRKSITSYEFCVTYKAASGVNGAGIGDAITGAAISRLNTQSGSSASSNDQQPTLFIDPSHTKGANCQTIDLSLFNPSPDPLQSGSDSGPVVPVPASTVSDVKRETDIDAIQGQIEAYFAENGTYPTLTNMNDTTWRATNLRGLDNSALIDPNAKTAQLTAVPAKNVYSYQVMSADDKPCDNTDTTCDVYTLTATLDNGSTYTKQNLN